VRDRHPELLQDSSFAQVVEAPYRRADMLSWLLRENVGRMEQLSSEMARQAAETERLHGEISRLEAERQVMARELDHHRVLADIGLMAAGVAHDFNNLLQVIAGHTAMVRGALSPGHPERDSLDKAISATQRASEMSRRLLSWARHEGGAPQPVILGDIAAEVLDLIAASAPPKVLFARALPAGCRPYSDRPTCAGSCSTGGQRVAGDRSGRAKCASRPA
jgi:signal transduction histidine kinase